MIGNLGKNQVIHKGSEKTSIIIPASCNATHLRECIESIRMVSCNSRYDITVVDYGTEFDVADWLKQQRDITVINSDNGKVYANGINQAVSITDGENILILHCDTIVGAGWLEKLKLCLDSSGDIGAVSPATNSRSYYQTIKTGVDSRNGIMQFLKEYNSCCHEIWEERVKLDSFCLLVKRTAFETAGGLKPELITDAYAMDDFCLRLGKSGYRNLFCLDTYIHHYGDDHVMNKQQSTSEDYWQDTKKFEEIWGFNLAYSTMIRNEIIEYINEPLTKEMNVLEIGCACGSTLLQIKNIYKNAQLFGIELNENSANIARLRADVKAENIEKPNLSYEEGFFDFIIFADVLEHLKQPGMVLNNLNKYLKPDGKVLASIPNVMHFSVLRELLNQRWEYKAAGILDWTHFRFFTKKEISEMFGNAGYAVVESKNNCYLETETDTHFINSLGKLAGKDLNQQYRTIQYIIKAEKCDKKTVSKDDPGREGIESEPFDRKLLSMVSSNAAKVLHVHSGKDSPNLGEGYDHIILDEILSELDNPWEYLARTATCLNPDGTLIMKVHNVANIRVIKDLLLGNGWSHWSPNPGNKNIRFYTLLEIGKMLDMIGFKVGKLHRECQPLSSEEEVFVARMQDMKHDLQIWNQDWLDGSKVDCYYIEASRKASTDVYRSENTSVSKEYENLKKTVKEQIRQLIDAGDLANAKVLIKEYRGIDDRDTEIYSMEAVAALMENKLEEAERILRQGLLIDDNNFDLLYNLGYIYEYKEQYDCAADFYKKALAASKSEGEKEEAGCAVCRVEAIFSK